MNRPYQLRQLAQLPAQNFIINGAFDFWQRATTSTSSNPNYTADRFAFNAPGGGGNSVTVSRSTDVPTLSEAKYQFSYSQLVTNNSAYTTVSNDLYQVKQAIEGYNYQALVGKTVTVAFWVKSSLAGTYTCALRNGSGTNAYTSPFVISSANTWELKTIEIQLESSTSGYGLANTTGLELYIVLDAGPGRKTSSYNQWLGSGAAWVASSNVAWAAVSGATFRVTGVMVLEGKFSEFGVLGFVRAGRTIHDEVALCQRYYEKSATPFSDGSAGLGTSDFRSSSYTGATSQIQVPFQVLKRATPTITTKNDVTITSGTTSMAYAVITVNNYTDGSVTAGERGFRFLAPSAHSAQPVAFGWSAESEL